MHRFWPILLLCLPALGWAQTDEQAPVVAPAEDVSQEVSATDARESEGEATEADASSEVAAEEVRAEDDATSDAVRKIEEAASAEALTEAEKGRLRQLLDAVQVALSPWSGDIAFGFLSTTGSSEATNYNTKLGLVYSVEQYKNDFSFNAIYGEQQGVRSIERYVVTNQTDYNINIRDFAFLALDFEKDSFGAIDERTSQTVGYGRRLLRGAVHTLNLNAGAGSRQQLPRDASSRDYEFIGRVAADYSWKITATSTFAQKFRMEIGSENTLTEAISELRLSIIGNVSANISFTARDNSLSSLTSQRTDTFTAVNLGYKFGS